MVRSLPRTPAGGRRPRDLLPVRRLLVVGALGLAVSGCGSSADARTYDISPVFPLSDPATKCAKYDGKLDGSEPFQHCYVTLAECEQAAGDWNSAMRQGGVTDAILFRC